MTEDEFKNKYLSRSLPIKKKKNHERHLEEEDIKNTLAKLPAKLNWKTAGKVSALKNQ